ncbi:MAG: hypothetical protein AAFQ66_19905 [Pseudomonadota bacterium]
MICQDEVQGHWQRIWIKAPGLHDDTTRVHWLQAGNHFADIRIPAERPSLGDAQCLAELPNTALADLLVAEGFAGTIQVDQGVCTWHRAINWHGCPDDVDAGRLSFDGSGDLIEDGVHADYRELWRHQPGAPFTAVLARCGELDVVLLTNDQTFLLATGIPAMASTAGLAAEMRSGSASPDRVRAQFACAYSLGHWQGGVGVADLSTDPFQERRPVLERDGNGLIWHRLGFDGSVSTQPLTVS